MNEQEKPKSVEERLGEWLRRGGQAQLRNMQTAELYEYQYPNRARSSAAGLRTIVCPIRDAKLKLTPEQRSIGVYLGAAVDGLNRTLGSIDLSAVRVDTSRATNGLSFSEEHAYLVQVTRIAFAWMERRPRLIYKLGKRKGPRKRGPHFPVPMAALMHAVCVQNYSLSVVGALYGWTAERSGQMVVPHRQRTLLSNGLEQGLDGIGEAWAAKGVFPPPTLALVDSE